MPDYFGGYSIAVSLVAIMLGIAGIILGLGYAIDDKRIKEFGKNEIYQSIINGVIVGSLFLAFSGSGIFTLLINNFVTSSSLSGSCQEFMSGNYAICFAYNYLVGLNPVSINGGSYPSLIDASLITLIPVSILYTILSLIGSIQLSLGFLSITLTSVLAPILTQLSYIIEAISFAIIGIEVQGVLLKFISVTAIPVLLPAGIVLRTFYLTRKLGGALIAASIGLYAIFPLTYVLNATLTSSYVGAIDNSSINDFVVSATGIQNNILNQGMQVNASKQSSGAISLFGYISNALNGLLRGIDNLLKGLANVVALLVVEVFFLPVFSLILTAISIRELAKILGSEISFSRLYIF